MNIHEAVRALRVALDDTQQSFAVRLGLAISTIVKYEADRVPHGRILADFAALAEEKGQEQLKKIFLDALVVEMGLARNAGYMSWGKQDDGVLRGYMFLRLEGEPQIDAAHAFYQAVMASTRAAMAKLLRDFHVAFEKARKK